MTDFVLWFTKSKFKNQLLLWDSPLGIGYPGWHIECSVMASKYLGERLDIHCGGVDHIPVHHTNEIAQSEAYFGHKWVNFWVHNEHVKIKDSKKESESSLEKPTKMSKSAGNFITLDTLIEKGFSPLAYRHLILSGSYRSHLAFSWEPVQASQIFVEKLNKKYQEYKASTELISNRDRINDTLQKFWGFLENDLSTPRALAVLNGVIKDREFNGQEKAFVLKEMNEALGLLEE